MNCWAETQTQVLSPMLYCLPWISPLSWCTSGITSVFQVGSPFFSQGSSFLFYQDLLQHHFPSQLPSPSLLDDTPSGTAGLWFPPLPVPLPFFKPALSPLSAAQHGIHSSFCQFPVSKAIFSYLTISALTRHLVPCQTLSPVAWLPNEELLAHFEASFLEATVTLSSLNIDFVYHRVEKIDENLEGGSLSACDF